MRPLHLRTPGLAERAESFRRAGVFDDTDLLLVDAIAHRFGESDADVLLGLAFATGAPRDGDVGIDLARLPDRTRIRYADLRDQGRDAPEVALAWPADSGAWVRRVLDSPMVGGEGDAGLPFARQVLRDGRTLLMSRRAWRDQERLAEGLARLASTCPAIRIDDATIEAWTARLFPDAPAAATAMAVRVAARGRLVVVTGGPGSGKTWSIKSMLALLLSARAPEDRPLRVVLAAPSGKAAVRMAEALAEGIEGLPVAPEVRAALLALTPRTLHGILGMTPGSPPRHDADSPVSADVIVVDEVSMVDLVALRRLVDAVPPGGRLVLLGDRDQLASVEAGTVLSDLVRGSFEPGASGPLAGCVVRLIGSHRTRDAPTLAAITEAIQVATSESLQRAARLLLGQEKELDAIERVAWLGAAETTIAGWRVPSPEALDCLAAPYLDGYVRVLRGRGAREHRAILEAFAAYRVLAVHRRGPLGVSGLEEALGQRVRGCLGAKGERGWWIGRPVLITRNAPEAELWNGDVGLVLESVADGRPVAVFPTASGPREVSLARLPEHSGALAMTVHKAQGSQFGRVALVLAGRDSPIQTRELVYTGVTRASERLDWLGSEEQLVRSLATPVERVSGLGELLWE